MQEKAERGLLTNICEEKMPNGGCLGSNKTVSFEHKKKIEKGGGQEGARSYSITRVTKSKQKGKKMEPIHFLVLRLRKGHYNWRENSEGTVILAINDCLKSAQQGGVTLPAILRGLKKRLGKDLRSWRVTCGCRVPISKKKEAEESAKGSVMYGETIKGGEGILGERNEVAGKQQTSAEAEQGSGLREICK